MSQKKRLPIGYEDFKRIIDEDLYYVDKSMFIYELIKNRGSNNLITRPRRFGKTLNFSMLRYFFDITEKDNAYLFDDLKISEYYSEIGEYRNAYPVITLSLKCAKTGDYDTAIYYLRQEIQGQFEKYSAAWNNDQVSTSLRQEIGQIMNINAGVKELGTSIKILCECLKQYYGKNTIILIDEYDVPLEDAYFSGYYDKMVRFIRSLFESALKTNSALEFSVITGCLRISKESIFTGLNNLKINSIMDALYSQYFGFEEKE
ncbi:MAG: AAA family ATPase, partial [bacterium]|nr:AAA family ATPase [bacterium]